eukprot:COSAG01_NODE_68582_length_263_cov_1.890244_1_plen_28_part_01
MEGCYRRGILREKMNGMAAMPKEGLDGM